MAKRFDFLTALPKKGESNGPIDRSFLLTLEYSLAIREGDRGSRSLIKRSYNGFAEKSIQ
jgi:hypothetical protein